MEKKGHIYLINALEKIMAEKKRKIKCYIIGRGPLIDELREKVSEKGLDDIITFTGFLPHDDMVNIFNSSDLFVLPSLHEGNPIVMFEALGLGKPYVGTDVGGVGEIITEDSYGLLCPIGDHEALADIIKEAMKIKWDTEKIIDYSKNYTWKKITETTLEEYEKLM